jgi:hypothetical protein
MFSDMLNKRLNNLRASRKNLRSRRDYQKWHKAHNDVKKAQKWLEASK